VEAMIRKGNQAAGVSTSGSVGGFSDGGFVAELQKIAMRNGDDVFTVNTLKAGEAVLTPEQTVSLAQLAEKLPVAHDVLDSSAYKREISIVPRQTGAQAITQQFGDLNIEIDHVEDYNDLVRKMCRDPHFEKMIQAMTIGRIAGKSSLEKYNCIKWK